MSILSNLKNIRNEEFTKYIQYSLILRMKNNYVYDIAQYITENSGKFKNSSLILFIKYFSEVNVYYPPLFDKVINRLMEDNNCLKDSVYIILIIV